jgi:superfamily II helicase
VGDKNALKTFLKEEGSEDVKPVEKLTLKKKDLEGKEGEVVVLEAQA